jgi:hypothetical protein
MTHENIATPRSKLVRDAILKYIYLETKKDPHNERPYLHLDGIAELANVPGEALTQQEVNDEARSLLDDGCIDGQMSAQTFAPSRAILTPLGKDIAAGLFTGDDGP